MLPLRLWSVCVCACVGVGRKGRRHGDGPGSRGHAQGWGSGSGWWVRPGPEQDAAAQQRRAQHRACRGPPPTCTRARTHPPTPTTRTPHLAQLLAQRVHHHQVTLPRVRSGRALVGRRMILPQQLVQPRLRGPRVSTPRRSPVLGQRHGRTGAAIHLAVAVAVAVVVVVVVMGQAQACPPTALYGCVVAARHWPLHMCRARSDPAGQPPRPVWPCTPPPTHMHACFVQPTQATRSECLGTAMPFHPSTCKQDPLPLSPLPTAYCCRPALRPNHTPHPTPPLSATTHTDLCLQLLVPLGPHVARPRSTPQLRLRLRIGLPGPKPRAGQQAQRAAAERHAGAGVPRAGHQARAADQDRRPALPQQVLLLELLRGAWPLRPLHACHASH